MKPILFNTEMVRAILDGRKTVTRRIIKETTGLSFLGVGIEPKEIKNKAVFGYGSFEDITNSKIEKYIKAPYQVGDILWVRETWMSTSSFGLQNGYLYKANAKQNSVIFESTTEEPKWKPSIHMPKEAARIFLKVANVRVGRLQDITPEEVMREGLHCDLLLNSGMCANGASCNPNEDKICRVENIKDFSKLWNGTIKKQDIEKYGWDSNPYVWVIEFEVIQ